jgi:hypothetical protein
MAADTSQRARRPNPPPDLSQNPPALRAEVLRWQIGTSLGFVHLRVGNCRSREDVVGIATRCGSMLRTGSVVAKLVAVDFGTLMFTMERGRDIPEVIPSSGWSPYSTMSAAWPSTATRPSATTMAADGKWSGQTDVIPSPSNLVCALYCLL